MRFVQRFLGRAVLAVAMCVGGSTAFADHQQPGQGQFGGVVTEAGELNNVVQWSNLRPNVKQTVARFANTAAQLGYCGDAPLAPVSVELFDHGGGAGCANLVNQLRWQWNQVERYLYDTGYDYPQVYQSYLNTRAALQQAGI